MDANYYDYNNHKYNNYNLRNCLNLIRNFLYSESCGFLEAFMAVFTESHKILSMNLTIKFKQFLKQAF